MFCFIPNSALNFWNLSLPNVLVNMSTLWCTGLLNCNFILASSGNCPRYWKCTSMFFNLAWITCFSHWIMPWLSQYREVGELCYTPLSTKTPLNYITSHVAAKVKLLCILLLLKIVQLLDTSCYSKRTLFILSGTHNQMLTSCHLHIEPCRNTCNCFYTLGVFQSPIYRAFVLGSSPNLPTLDCLGVSQLLYAAILFE